MRKIIATGLEKNLHNPRERGLLMPIPKTPSQPHHKSIVPCIQKMAIIRRKGRIAPYSLGLYLSFQILPSNPSHNDVSVTQSNQIIGHLASRRKERVPYHT